MYDRPQNGRSDRARAKKAILGADRPKMLGSTQNGRFNQKWSIGQEKGGGEQLNGEGCK